MKARGVTIVVHVDGDPNTRKYHVPLWSFEVGKWGAVTVGLLVVLFFAFAEPLTHAAARVPGLEREVARLRQENGRVQDLAAALNRAEANYQELRQLLGVRAPAAQTDAPPGPELMRAVALRAQPPTPAPSPAATATATMTPTPTPAPTPAPTPVSPTPPPLSKPVPAPTAAPAPRTSATATSVQYESGLSMPSHWPLDVRGFVTRGQVRPGDPAESHAGIDIAVPVGSPVRASGGGIVETAGIDSAYGMFVLLQHPGRYETMYGHASRLVVHAGDSVQAGQVIALSGSSGRSTAPHLHFEIRLDGKSIDPLTMVKQEN
jgi:murein DD-endopeptidase MepM/ murein hydrolase activator NlpD